MCAHMHVFIYTVVITDSYTGLHNPIMELQVGGAVSTRTYMLLVLTACPPFRFFFSSRAATRQHVRFCCSLKFPFAPSMHRLRLPSLGTTLQTRECNS